MYQHKYFDLCLHDNNELEEVLQAEIVARKTLHEWPLSCVEQLITSQGDEWIYKSQFGPTVESQFYARARSRLLVAGKTLFSSETGHTNMLFEFIKDPLIKDLNLSDDAVVTAGHSIIENIALVEGELPYYLDISTKIRWEALMENMLDNLRRLVSQGTFKSADHELLCNLREWAFCEKVWAALSRNVGLVHNDLNGDNVFVSPEGYRIIDWQRPILGPRELDLASLLDSLGREPAEYVDEGVVWLMYLLRIEWFTECAVRWFPEGQDSYDKAITRLAHLVEKSA
jgi:hypothetical protein